MPTLPSANTTICQKVSSAGRVGEGIGGPHEGSNMIWPMAIIMQALASHSQPSRHIQPKKCQILILYCNSPVQTTRAVLQGGGGEIYTGPNVSDGNLWKKNAVNSHLFFTDCRCVAVRTRQTSGTSQTTTCSTGFVAVAKLQILDLWLLETRRSIRII